MQALRHPPLLHQLLPYLFRLLKSHKASGVHIRDHIDQLIRDTPLRHQRAVSSALRLLDPVPLLWRNLRRRRHACQRIDEEEREERSDEWLSRRLDAGLFCLQTVDTILAWLVAEDPAAKKRVLDFMPSLQPVKASLAERLEDLDPEGQQDEDMREMLGTLLSFLE